MQTSYVNNNLFQVWYQWHDIHNVSKIIEGNNNNNKLIKEHIQYYNPLMSHDINSIHFLVTR